MTLDLIYPVAFAAVLWWFGTGLILFLDGLKPSSFRWSMIGATVVLVGAFWAVDHVSELRSQTGAFISFTCGLLIWAWLEMSFLMGVLTGPRRTACPPDCRGFRRMMMAIEAIMYHELAAIAAGTALVVLTWGDANPLATWTFIVLWGMRVSAKLNLFFGVRNRSEEFLPPHLTYLASYFTRKPVNPFFPVSIGASLMVLGLLVNGIIQPGTVAYDDTARAFLAALMGLAILEHVFMVTPKPISSIWTWGMKSRVASEAAKPTPLALPGQKSRKTFTHRGRP